MLDSLYVVCVGTQLYRYKLSFDWFVLPYPSSVYKLIKSVDKTIFTARRHELGISKQGELVYASDRDKMILVQHHRWSRLAITPQLDESGRETFYFYTHKLPPDYNVARPLDEVTWQIRLSVWYRTIGRAPHSGIGLLAGRISIVRCLATNEDPALFRGNLRPR